MSHFHPIQTPIQPGLTLLEAGAGTGKTYSLVRLVARQIVEQDIPIDEILTVTFTKAATAEIQSRLQSLLHQLFSELTSGAIEDGTEALDLTIAWRARGEEFLAEAIKRLRIALCNFDQANIYTIDSFFQRLTKEFSLDCRTLSSLEIEPNSSPLIEAAVRDYWRQHVYPMSAEELSKFKVSLSTARNFIQQRLQTPNAQLDPAYHADPEEYKSLRNSFVSLLQEHPDNLRSFLENKTSCFHGGKPPFNKAGKSKLLAYIDAILADPSSINLQPEQLQHLSLEHLSQSSLLKKGATFTIQEHPLLPLFQGVVPLLKIPTEWDQCIQLGHLEQYVQSQLPKIKSAKEVQTYDDITENLYHLLQTENGDRVRYSCRAKYRAISIDEFQDTSPYQCDIFLKLFHHLGGTLHIIGDPKQSIYRFRGADVFAYLNARSLADHRYELLTNHRSSQSLVQGVNHVFQQSDDPFFSQKAIEFHPATAANEIPSCSPPLKVRHIEGNNQVDVVQDVTAQISRLLNSDWSDLYTDKLGKVKAGDISILVRSGQQAQALSDSLSKWNIPCSIRTSSNLFASPEATEFRLLLDAILQPHYLGSIKLALLTPALGSGIALTENDDDLLSIMELFSATQEVWLKRGLLPAVNQLDRSLTLRKTLLGLNGGERRVTNYFHIAELLDAKARKDSLSPLAIQQWLESALQGDTDELEADTDQLRVASDSEAVQIQTIHASKGLQFPIVFAPFTYSAVKTGNLIYHQNGQTHIAPIGNNTVAIEERLEEEKADTARLLYVALTRAEYHCIVHVDVLKSSSRKKIAFHEMLGKPTLESWQDIVQSSESSVSFTSIAPEDIETPSNYIPISSSETQPDTLQCAPPLERQPKRQHNTSSFTGLTRNLPDPRDTDPHEETTKYPTEYFQSETFWSYFQPGAALGLVFHEFFEEADFQDTSGHETIFKAKLDKYQPQKANTSIPNSVLQDILAWIPSVLTHQLHSFLPIRLADLGQYQRLNEAQFLLPAHDLSLTEFAKLLEENPPPYLPEGYTEQLRRIPKRQFEGFLDGIIDLIFEHGGRYHLLDWKTNQITENTPQGLASVMSHHHYFLQYHLYSLALDALLKNRIKGYDPELHLGEIFYVFLRGITRDVAGASVGSGVYTDRLSPLRMTKLSNAFHLEPDEELC